jgi:hypothetical protein
MLTHNNFEQKFREGKKKLSQKCPNKPPNYIMTVERMQEPS